MKHGDVPHIGGSTYTSHWMKIAREAEEAKRQGRPLDPAYLLDALISCADQAYREGYQQGRADESCRTSFVGFFADRMREVTADDDTPARVVGDASKWPSDVRAVTAAIADSFVGEDDWAWSYSDTDWVARTLVGTAAGRVLLHRLEGERDPDASATEQPTDDPCPECNGYPNSFIAVDEDGEAHNVSCPACSAAKQPTEDAS